MMKIGTLISNEIFKLPENIQAEPAMQKFVQSLEGSMTDLLVELTKEQQTKTAFAIAELAESSMFLTNMISSMRSGILVETEHRRIRFTNQMFCDIFQINAKPKQLVGADCSGSAEASKGLMKDPDYFVKRITQILSERKVVYNEEVALADGRTFSRDYVPVFINNTYKGHLWEYRDILKTT